MQKPVVHKLFRPGYEYAVCGLWMGRLNRVGTFEEQEVTCKICLAGGQGNYRKMTKQERMGFKSNDACLQKAGENEMIFVLRAQDKSSPKVVLHWIAKNFENVSEEKLREAFECALAMRRHPTRKDAD